MNGARATLYGRWLLTAVCLVLACVAAAQEPARAALVDLTFDQVDVRTFVKVVAEVSGRRFAVDDQVKGAVTVVAPKIPATNVYPLAMAILETVGCAVVEEAGFTRVTVWPARATPGAPVYQSGAALPAAGLVTRVILLRHVPAADIRKMLEPLVGREKGAALAAVETTNHLIVTDTAENIRRLEQVLEAVDRPGLGVTADVVFLKSADAIELAQQFGAVAGRADPARPGREPYLQRPARDRERELSIVGLPHANAVVLIGAPSEVEEMKRLLDVVDVDPLSGRGHLHALFLQHIAAEEAAKSLNALLEKSAAQDPQKGDRRRIAIEAISGNNALLVAASPPDFERVRTLIADLDRMPQQVLIEVVIAEISLTDESDIGVEMAAVQSPSKVGDTVVQGGSRLGDSAEGLLNAVQSGIFPRGISIGVARATGVDAEGRLTVGYPAVLNINAMRKKGHVKILSSIPLLAQNNHEASVSVVNNIPILKSTIQGGTGAERDIIQNIERLDVGIKLKLTPHVSPSNEVRMLLNPSIEALIDPGPSGTQFAPTIARREVSTTVTVPNGRTIVISGLIREDQTSVIRRIPILGSIPLAGWLFRHSIRQRERTNLIVLVTPHVLTGEESVENLAGEWGARMGLSSSNLLQAVSAGTTNAP